MVDRESRDGGFIMITIQNLTMGILARDYMQNMDKCVDLKSEASVEVSYTCIVFQMTKLLQSYLI